MAFFYLDIFQSSTFFSFGFLDTGAHVEGMPKSCNIGGK